METAGFYPVEEIGAARRFYEARPSFRDIITSGKGTLFGEQTASLFDSEDMRLNR